jgi:hypothetical protein
MTTVAILIPTKGRAEQFIGRIAPLLIQPMPVKVMVIASILEDDGRSIMAVAALDDFNWKSDLRYVIRSSQESTSVQGWNKAYHYAKHYRPDWFVSGADDLIWSNDWLAEALKVADKTNAQVIGLNDLHTDLNNFAPHYMLSGQFAEEHLGDYMVPPMYKAWWFDQEICHKAQALGLYAPAPLAVVEHTHPNWATAEMDDTYKDAWARHEEDRFTYEARKVQAFPLNYTERERQVA